MTEEIDYTNPDYIPPHEEYVRFLKNSRITDFERSVLLALYAAPGHEARNADIAEAISSEMLPVNGALGRLGGKAVDYLKINLPDRALPSHAIAWFGRPDGYWYSVMHDSVRAAIVALGWADEAAREYGEFWRGNRGTNPAAATGAGQTDEAGTETETYLEGRRREHLRVSRARNGRARDECIAHYGPHCDVCIFDFEVAYGERGRAFIEVHHLELVSGQQEEEYEIDPIKDLRPVCSNCHRMLHRYGLISTDELKEIVKAQRASRQL
jgi:hypothetical protein